MIVFVFFLEEVVCKEYFKGCDVMVVVFVGKLIVECVVKEGVKIVVFDCGGYIYYGCVKVFVEVVCEGGLDF